MHDQDPEARRRARHAGDRPTDAQAGLRLQVTAVAAEVATVRHAVLEAAEAHGIAGAPYDDIALAVSEACANVVMHAYPCADTPGPLSVEAYRKDGQFVVVVRDEGIGIAPRADSPGLGLGLGIIGRVAQRLEITRNTSVGATLMMAFAATRARAEP